MNIAIINAWTFGSTGHIMLNLAKEARAHGYNVYTFSKTWAGMDCSNLKDHYCIGSFFDTRLHGKLSLYTGLNGFFSVIPTIRLIIKLKKIKPDLIHLHNLHGWYVNLPILFRYIKKSRIPVIWTLHDCWSFTGQCPHFTMAGCDKWKRGCFSCPQIHAYPESKVDVTRLMWKLKKRWFTGIENMTLVTPSKWLAGLVKQSFLKDYPIKVINNGIDLEVFKPAVSDFRQKYGIEGKYMLLGVSFGWSKRKGLDVFIQLAQRLPENYKIVLVGTDDAVDDVLPENIISIHRTEDQRELAEIYSAADLFVNPTREENYPTVNMESLACGTPVLTFNTGGSPEIIDDSCGAVVDCDDVEALIEMCVNICENKSFSREACLTRSAGFNQDSVFEAYTFIYDKIYNKKKDVFL